MLTASERLAEFARDGEIDFSYTVRGLARFRVNAFRQRGSISIACRVVPFEIRAADELGLPEVVTRLAGEPRGIILVTGTTGSGKSTTLAAMVDHINRNFAEEHRHDRGPDRVPAPRPEVGRPPARDRLRHQLLLAGAAPRAAPGPRRDPDRGDARRGDRGDRAQRGRDRPPRAQHAAHDRRGRDRQPDHRLLPAAPPPAGARDARRLAARRDLAAARADDRRRGPRAGLRGAHDDRPRARPDRRTRPRPASSAR